MNPNKYKKYDLSDVSKDQLSDKSNSRAAFDFLRQLKDRKNDDESNENQGYYNTGWFNPEMRCLLILSTNNI